MLSPETLAQLFPSSLEAMQHSLETITSQAYYARFGDGVSLALAVHYPLEVSLQWPQAESLDHELGTLAARRLATDDLSVLRMLALATS